MLLNRQNKQKSLWINLVLVLGIIVVFLLLRYLTPDPSGLGTHQQIIPVPCFFRAVCHIPCPSCGITTSLTYLLQGDLHRAFKTHSFGPIIFFSLMAVFFLSFWGLLTQTSWWNIIKKRGFQNFLICATLAYIGVWLLRLIF